MYTPGQEHHNLLWLLDYHIGTLLCCCSLMLQRETEELKKIKSRSKDGVIMSLRRHGEESISPPRVRVESRVILT